MAAVKSSAHPADRKQPWGTILKPDFGLGYQKISEEAVTQAVNRLYFIPKTKPLCSFRMAAVKSSAHPADRKQPWGTILKPDFGLGYQKISEEEVTQAVNRLYFIPKTKSRNYARAGKKMSSDEIEEMLQRLTTVQKEKIPDSDRRLCSSPVSMMGVVSSYAWNGYNHNY